MWNQTAPDNLRALAYSGDSRTLFTVEANRVLSWDIKAARSTLLFQVIDDPRFVVTNACVTADGQFLVLSTWADCVVWDLVKGERRPDFRRGWSWLVPAPEGCEIRFMGKNRTAIRVYDPSNGQERKFTDVSRGLGKMSAWALSPDNKRLLLLNSSQEIIEQNVATSAAATALPPDPSGVTIDAICFSPDNKSVVLLFRNEIDIRNAVDLSRRARLPAPFAAFSFAFHPTAPYFAAPNANKELTLYDLNTGKPVHEFKFRLGEVTRQVAFAPDGSSCAACGSDCFGVFEVAVLRRPWKAAT